LRPIRKYDTDKTRFLTKDNRTFEAESFLMDDEQIAHCLKQANLEQLGSFDLRLPKTEKDISPDILTPAKAINVSPYDLPIVKLIVARKP
jgi:hypothetical protein